MELVRLEVALGESVNKWFVNVKAQDIIEDFINTMQLECLIFIKQHEMQSCPRKKMKP